MVKNQVSRDYLQKFPQVKVAALFLCKEIVIVLSNSYILN